MYKMRAPVKDCRLKNSKKNPLWDGRHATFNPFKTCKKKFKG